MYHCPYYQLSNFLFSFHFVQLNTSNRRTTFSGDNKKYMFLFPDSVKTNYYCNFVCCLFVFCQNFKNALRFLGQFCYFSFLALSLHQRSNKEFSISLQVGCSNLSHSFSQTRFSDTSWTGGATDNILLLNIHVVTLESQDGF